MKSSHSVPTKISDSGKKFLGSENNSSNESYISNSGLIKF